MYTKRTISQEIFLRTDKWNHTVIKLLYNNKKQRNHQQSAKAAGRRRKNISKYAPNKGLIQRIPVELQQLNTNNNNK